MAAAILRTWRKKWTGSNLESLLYNISIQIKSTCTSNPVLPSDQLGMGEVARCIIIEEFAGRSCFHLKSISRILLQKRSECVLMWCIFSCWLFKSALFGLYLVTWERNLVLWPTSWSVGCLGELGLRSPFPLDVVCDWLVFSVKVWEVVLSMTLSWVIWKILMETLVLTEKGFVIARGMLNALVSEMKRMEVKTRMSVNLHLLDLEPLCPLCWLFSMANVTKCSGVQREFW